METKNTHGGKRAGTGRKNKNSVPYKTTVPGDLLEKFLKYYPKKMLNEALKDFLDKKIAEAEEKVS
jgi:hypothetical protein